MLSDSSSTVRIGTWNLGLQAAAPTADWQAKARWLDARSSRLWLLTEAHQSWDPRDGHLTVSPPRKLDPEHGRWAAIETTLDTGEPPAQRNAGHAAEEGLALARVRIAGRDVLVACSVLPYDGIDAYWDGLPTDAVEQFAYVLDHHVLRIRMERRTGEPLIWGGDFNQPLVPPFSGGSRDCGAALCSALRKLGLTSLTQGLAHRNGQMYSVDHLAISGEFLAEHVEMHRPVRGDDSSMSSHAAYTADLVLPRT
ncbi:hypothetical protein SAMN05660657_02323 [Geodermatophilus amargosae]|uniref:Endonuclease/Exonuclease/phosphatase family protein n=1 Tax=Geodermatophilus amargosae TaxID=1296565 RepID=A0A1I6ZXD1_9ACTN|nr:hypothetical protein [Geodermatophilus amargosae]SFT67287.1 hypothetical protein SAMN05660657_02323 [Geodermatophilus amargosae]